MRIAKPELPDRLSIDPMDPVNLADLEPVQVEVTALLAGADGQRAGRQAQVRRDQAEQRVRAGQRLAGVKAPASSGPSDRPLCLRSYRGFSSVEEDTS